jgi:hypothetical protein
MSVTRGEKLLFPEETVVVLAPANLVSSVRVKRPPKPVPVKRRPPTARRFYFTEPAVPLHLYIRHIPRPSNVANAPPGRRLPSMSTTPLCLLFLGRSDCAPPGQHS